MPRTGNCPHGSTPRGTSPPPGLPRSGLVWCGPGCTRADLPCGYSPVKAAKSIPRFGPGPLKRSWPGPANLLRGRKSSFGPPPELQRPVILPAVRGAETSDAGPASEASDAGSRPAAVPSPVALAGRRSTVAVDLAANTVLLDGVPVSFTAMEHSLLRYLVENLSRAIPREELQRFLESLDCPGAAFRSIDVYVGRVRRKLGSARHVIATVRGGGYQFVPGPGSTVRGPAEYCI